MKTQYGRLSVAAPVRGPSTIFRGGDERRQFKVDTARDEDPYSLDLIAATLKRRL